MYVYLLSVEILLILRTCQFIKHIRILLQLESLTEYPSLPLKI